MNYSFHHLLVNPQADHHGSCSYDNDRSDIQEQGNFVILHGIELIWF